MAGYFEQYGIADERRSRVIRWLVISVLSAVVLTIISGLTTVACCLFTAPALILGIVALTRQSTDPAGSARMARYGWIAFAVAIGLTLVAGGILLAFGVGGFVDEPGSYEGY